MLKQATSSWSLVSWEHFFEIWETSFVSSQLPTRINTQLSPPHRDQLHVLVAAPNQLVQSRKTNLPRDAMQEDHGSLDDPQKHMSSTETGYHGFSPMHFLWLPSSTSPDHNSRNQQLNEGLKVYAKYLKSKRRKGLKKHISWLYKWFCWILLYFPIPFDPTESEQIPTHQSLPIDFEDVGPQLRLAACLCLPGQRNEM